MNSRRKRILFLLPSLAGGGAQRVFSILLRYLDRSQFELHLGLLQAKGPYVEEIPRDVAVHELKVSRVRFALPSIAKLVWKIRPEALLSTLPHLNLALTIGRRLLPPGTKVLVREAAISSTVLAEETNFPMVWAWLYKHFYKRADKIVCLSESMVDDLVSHFGVPREKIVRIYNPVDSNKVRELARTEKNPYTGAGPHIVTAGRLSRQKGFDLLLNAMPAVLRRFPHAELAILGNGPLSGCLMRQAQALGVADAVAFLGFQPNPWPYIKHADVFVLASRYEGLPNILLEARALNVPAIATDCPGGTREIAEVDSGVRLVPSEDVGALTSAIVSVCQETKNLHRNGDIPGELLKRFGAGTIVAHYSALLSN